MRAKRSPAPAKPMTRPAMSPVCELDLELPAARLVELLATAVETTVTCCHLD